MTPEQRLERANHAEKLLKDPLLVEAFEAARTKYLETFENAPVRDHEGVHEIHLMLKLLRDVKSHIEQAVRDGKVIVATLEEKRRLAPSEFSASFRR